MVAHHHAIFKKKNEYKVEILFFRGAFIRVVVVVVFSSREE